jgi:hypothetical protein
MRRALVGIVPNEILNRRGKAFVARAFLVGFSRDWVNLVETTRHMVSDSIGIVDPDRFLAALQKGRRGEEVPMVTLKRTILLERWLGNLQRFGIVKIETPCKHGLTLRASIEG